MSAHSRAHDDLTAPYLPLAGLAQDGWSKDGRATATCFCGAVQISIITASMFATNVTVADSHLTHVRGLETLKTFAQSATIATGNVMTNHFCSNCGTLMYRRSSGFPGLTIARLGTVDDFHLHETKLKPTVEQYVKDRAGWLSGVEGVTQLEGSFTAGSGRGASKL